MPDLIYEGPPRSGNDIERLAETVREIFGLAQVPYFPVVEFLERGLDQIAEGMVFDVMSKAEMGPLMGSVDTRREMLYVREDVYQGAVTGNGRDRFTVCHEVGHVLLHVGKLHRIAPTAKREIFRDPEWQANRFAAALLMPRALVATCKSVREIAHRFGVSFEAAELRARTLKLGIN